MTQHSRKVKIIKWLIDFRKQLAASSERLKQIYGIETPPDFMMYQGVLHCQISSKRSEYNTLNDGATTGDAPRRIISISSPPDPNIRPKKINQKPLKSDLAKPIEDQLWENFNQPAAPLVNRFFAESESLYFSHSTKSRPNSFTPLKIKDSESKNEYSESLGTYMRRMRELVLRKAPSSYKKRIVGALLKFLKPFLFKNIEQELSPEEIIVFEQVHQTTLKKTNWSDLDFKNTTRESAHPIEKYLAAKIIHKLVDDLIEDFSWGRFYTLLYIWIALFAAFSGIRLTVEFILDLSFPDSMSNEISEQNEIAPIFLFEIQIKPLSHDLSQLLRILKGKKWGKVFQIDRSTIERALGELTQELGFSRQKDPQKPEKFLLLTPETFLSRPYPCYETGESEVTDQRQ